MVGGWGLGFWGFGVLGFWVGSGAERGGVGGRRGGWEGGRDGKYLFRDGVVCVFLVSRLHLFDSCDVVAGLPRCRSSIAKPLSGEDCTPSTTQHPPSTAVF